MSVRSSFLFLGLSLIAPMASAQTVTKANVFFAFEFLFKPIAIKWACGGEAETDLSTFYGLIAEFPEDAELAKLPTIVDDMVKANSKNTDLSELLGEVVSPEQAEQLCALTLPLSLTWLTPELLVATTDNQMPEDQQKVWEAFYQFISEQ